MSLVWCARPIHDRHGSDILRETNQELSCNLEASYRKPMAFRSLYGGRSMNRSVNGSGADEWLLWDATKPRAVRKAEARSPARHVAESCCQPLRRVGSRGSVSGVGSGSHASPGLERPELVLTARESSYVRSQGSLHQPYQPQVQRFRTTSVGVKQSRIWRTAVFGRILQKFWRPASAPKIERTLS